VWGPVGIPLILTAGAVLLAAFVVWQRVNTREPLLPLSLFADRTFAAANLANVCIGFAITGMFLPVVIFLQSVLGLSPVQSGLVTLPMSLVSGLIAPVAGRLSDRVPGKYVALVGFAALAVGVGWLALGMRTGMDVVALVPALVVCGVGIGCVFSPLANLATSTVALPRMGAASGIFNTTRQVGSVVGSAAIGVLLQARLTVSVHAAAVTAAGALPAPARPGFLGGMTQAAGSASEAGAGASCPAARQGRVCELATSVFQHGFTDAARATLALPAIVLAVGAVACLVMARKPRRAVADAAPDARPVPEPA
jgi:MFS family permease